MFSQKQELRLTEESKYLTKFLQQYDRIQLLEKTGSVSDFYRIGFKNVNTSVVKHIDELKMNDPPVKILPVSFEIAFNIPESYPLAKPEIMVLPPFSNGEKWLHYNSHIFLFSICLFSIWRVNNSLIDVVRRTWNVVTYNHNILNLNRLDCLNPSALEWYKKTYHSDKNPFPLDHAIENIVDGLQREKKFFHFAFQEIKKQDNKI